jgi:hypothetical protein
MAYMHNKFENHTTLIFIYICSFLNNTQHKRENDLQNKVFQIDGNKNKQQYQKIEFDL